jgi:hypothetical protein
VRPFIVGQADAVVGEAVGGLEVGARSGGGGLAADSSAADRARKTAMTPVRFGIGRPFGRKSQGDKFRIFLYLYLAVPGMMRRLFERRHPDEINCLRRDHFCGMCDCPFDWRVLRMDIMQGRSNRRRTRNAHATRSAASPDYRAGTPKLIVKRNGPYLAASTASVLAGH